MTRNPVRPSTTPASSVPTTAGSAPRVATDSTGPSSAAALISAMRPRSVNGHDRSGEQRGLREAGSAFDLEHAALGGDAAWSREPVQRAVGGEDAVARDDDRERVAAQRGADGPGRGRRADRPRDLAVGRRLSRADGTGRGVHGPPELVDVTEVEHDL